MSLESSSRVYSIEPLPLHKLEVIEGARASPPLGNYTIVCPYCKEQETHVITGDHTRLSCEKCSEPFGVFLAKIRAKRGRKSKIGMFRIHREYVIRCYSRAGEEIIRFDDYSGFDFDLRSGDIFYLAYEETINNPKIISNLTTKQFLEIKGPWSFDL